MLIHFANIDNIFHLNESVVWEQINLLTNINKFKIMVLNKSISGCNGVRIENNVVRARVYADDLIIFDLKNNCKKRC